MTNAAVFLLSMALATAAYFLGLAIPATSPAAKALTAAFTLSALAAVVDYDVMEFRRGAWATISQVTLRCQGRCPALVPTLAFVAGVLSVHLSVPRVPGDPIPWGGLARWGAVMLACFALGGALAGPLGLLQAPDRDVERAARR